MCSSSYKEKIELSENDTLFGTAKKTASFLYEYDVFLVYDPDYDHYSAEVSNIKLRFLTLLIFYSCYLEVYLCIINWTCV